MSRKKDNRPRRDPLSIRCVQPGVSKLSRANSRFMLIKWSEAKGGHANSKYSLSLSRVRRRYKRGCVFSSACANVRG